MEIEQVTIQDELGLVLQRPLDDEELSCALNYWGSADVLKQVTEEMLHAPYLLYAPYFNNLGPAPTFRGNAFTGIVAQRVSMTGYAGFNIIGDQATYEAKPIIYRDEKPMFVKAHIENIVEKRIQLLTNVLRGLSIIVTEESPPLTFVRSRVFEKQEDNLVKFKDSEGKLYKINVVTGEITITRTVSKYETRNDGSLLRVVNRRNTYLVGKTNQFGVVHTNDGQIYTLWELAAIGENKPGIDEVLAQVQTLYDSKEALPREIRIPTRYLLDKKWEREDSQTMDAIVRKLEKDYQIGKDYNIRIVMSEKCRTLDIVLTRKK
ncbi:hypothetical protein KA001_01505 [Patescibacteria group bacterium]|nr:hypothetical protein [Patescibacteria group bacterium]